MKAQANPRAPIHEVADPSPRFFEEVARKGRAVKIDVVAERQVDPHRRARSGRRAMPR